MKLRLVLLVCLLSTAFAFGQDQKVPSPAVAKVTAPAQVQQEKVREIKFTFDESLPLKTEIQAFVRDKKAPPPGQCKDGYSWCNAPMVCCCIGLVDCWCIGAKEQCK